jgi:superfamily II DNA or RNA helicase
MAGHKIADDLKGGLIWGETPMNKRQTMIDNFQRGDLRVLVCTIGAAKTGITLTAANQMIFNDLPWVPADYLQAEKRIHRIGQDQGCVIHIATAPGVDSMIAKTVLSKARDLTAILGNGQETAIDF